MSKAFLNLLQVCLYTLGFSFASSQISLAQVTSDNTLNTEVNQNGNVAAITGGETREGNLFHSFQDFSVPTNNEAFFNNANDISNIFSRVTGGNVSNIDGLIRANGSANLFLINLSGTGEFILSNPSNLVASGIFADALIESGKGGDINLTTDQLTISDGAIITASNFSGSGEENGGSAPGTGEPGNISITANSLSLESEGRIEATTQAETGTGAEINLQVANGIFLKGDSFISAEALGNANGIDTKFIVAFAEGNNDIIANAEQGQGGNIDITAESLFGIKASTLNPYTNDINASSDFGLDGSVSIDIPDVNSLQGVSELSTNIVVPEETTAQACNANRQVVAKNRLVIKGKGGVPAAPEMPLNSANIIVAGEINDNDSTSAIPQPVETSIGKIQPARGIKVTKKGGIILTAYRTNNQGDRLPTIETSCGLTKNES